MDDIEMRISQVLNRSRETVMRFGGKEGIRVYQSTQSMYLPETSRSHQPDVKPEYLYPSKQYQETTINYSSPVVYEQMYYEGNAPENLRLENNTKYEV